MVKRFKKNDKAKKKVFYKPFGLIANTCKISIIMRNDENISFY